jgi:hypothetical protein
MSSTLLFDFPDHLRAFRQLVVACQTAISQPTPDRPAVTRQVKQLESMIQDHLLPLPATALPPQHQSLWLSTQTELRRTLRLLRTELSFWQMARSGDRQQHCQKRLQHHYQQLSDIAQVMEQWLESMDPSPLTD